MSYLIFRLGQIVLRGRPKKKINKMRRVKAVWEDKMGESSRLML